jgi:hypothetical protein
MARERPSRARVSTPIGLDAFLADSVSSEGGKLHAQGAGWNRIYAEVLPTVHGRIGLALLLRVPAERAGEPHELDVRLEAPDGSLLPLGLADEDSGFDRIHGTFQLDPPPPGAPVQEEEVFPIALNLDGLPLATAGTYRFMVAIDGADARAIPFGVGRR